MNADTAPTKTIGEVYLASSNAEKAPHQRAKGRVPLRDLALVLATPGRCLFLAPRGGDVRVSARSSGPAETPGRSFATRRLPSPRGRATLPCCLCGRCAGPSFAVAASPI